MLIIKRQSPIKRVMNTKVVHTKLAILVPQQELFTPIHLQFPALLGHYYVSKCEIRCKHFNVTCFSCLAIYNDTAKTRLVTLPFLYSGVFVKNSDVGINVQPPIEVSWQ